jgi:hypothetical protein
MRFFIVLLGLLICRVSLAIPGLSVTEVAPGVFVHISEHHWPDRTNHGEIANIGFIVGEQCVAVIDSGGSPQQAGLLCDQYARASRSYLWQ